MSKITFRADDDLVAAVEDLDASKSEVMRDALRAYLDGARPTRDGATDDGRGGIERLDDVVADRVDAVLANQNRDRGREPQDVNLNITIETDGAATARTDDGAAGERDRSAPGGNHACQQCGESLDGDHVYCPNCGEKATQRVFCECGDEVRADWAFCPHCGRRTASADVLDR